MVLCKYRKTAHFIEPYVIATAQQRPRIGILCLFVDPKTLLKRVGLVNIPRYTHTPHLSYFIQCYCTVDLAGTSQYAWSFIIQEANL